jgi:hypothetical protein
MATRLSFREWKPSIFGDVIVGHILYFANLDDGSTTAVIRSHGLFYRLPLSATLQVNELKPADGSLLVVEYLEEGYRVSVLCEYKGAEKKRSRHKQLHHQHSSKPH